MGKLSENQEQFEKLLQAAATVLATEQEKEADQLFQEVQCKDEHIFPPELDAKILALADSSHKKKSGKLLTFPQRTFLKYAACFVLIIALGGTVAMMNTNAFRSHIYKFFYEDKQEYTHIDLVPDGNEDYAFSGEHEKAPYRFPAYIPSGYSLKEKEETEHMLMMRYENANGDHLILVEDQVMGSVMAIGIDTEDAQIVETLTIGDMEGMYVYKNGFSSLIFHDDELSIHLFGKNMDKTEIMKIANSLSS